MFNGLRTQHEIYPINNVLRAQYSVANNLDKDM